MTPKICIKDEKRFLSMMPKTKFFFNFEMKFYWNIPTKMEFRLISDIKVFINSTAKKWLLRFRKFEFFTFYFGDVAGKTFSGPSFYNLVINPFMIALVVEHRGSNYRRLLPKMKLFFFCRFKNDFISTLTYVHINEIIKCMRKHTT